MSAERKQVIRKALEEDTSWCDDFGESTITEMTRRVAAIVADVPADHYEQIGWTARAQENRGPHYFGWLFTDQKARPGGELEAVYRRTPTFPSPTERKENTR